MINHCVRTGQPRQIAALRHVTHSNREKNQGKSEPVFIDGIHIRRLAEKKQKALSVESRFAAGLHCTESTDESTNLFIHTRKSSAISPPLSQKRNLESFPAELCWAILTQWSDAVKEFSFSESDLPVWVLESKNVLVVSTVIVPIVPSVICAHESRRPRYLFERKWNQPNVAIHRAYAKKSFCFGIT